MKVSIIPAQITTVEDRIAANLNLTQLILLSIPLFITALVFFLFPPIGGYALYKIVISVPVTSLSAVLAIRINDKLLLDLIRLRAKFVLRPNVYVYGKQVLKDDELKYNETIFYRRNKKRTPISSEKISLRAKANSNKLLRDADYKVSFKSKSGGLSVEVSSIQ